ncbi:MAG: agmatine deiminase family protein, partial [Gammaproteobacteria bacterium]|nr:agmatine deiminase family protein [Gammaproteobacteria bacterium]
LETVLKRRLGMEQVLWIENSFLAGDDTDGHIDMLARFAPGNTIVYVQCENKDDEHYTGFQAMEQELKAARNAEGKAYNLIALPFADAVYVDGDRLPLSYANYLIINDAVLVPQYGVSQDKQALDIIAQAHPGREMIAIDALPAIKQGGSIHCLSMQLPKGVLRP